MEIDEISKQVEKAYSELYQECVNENALIENKCKKSNESKCSVCGSKEFIVKYRDVHGEIHGSVSGYFSLFDGSISGYVDGSTETSPVLSCRECQNERKICMAELLSTDDLWSRQVPYMSDEYIGVPEEGCQKVSKWLQDYGLEVACELQKQKFGFVEGYNRFYKYYSDEYPRFSEKQFAYLGLVRKFPEIEKNKYVKNFGNDMFQIYETSFFVAIFIVIILVLIVNN